MPTYFCLTVRFLQPDSHGRGGDDEPEWPPSPLRVFQALVAAAAARWNERMRLKYAASALQWLERQPPPSIVAPLGIKSDTKYRLYVPDNVADRVAKSWSAGREDSIADYRTEKDVRLCHLCEGETVHYLYPLANDDCPHMETLSAAARSITHVGWGVDMVAGNAAIISEKDAVKLPGERWRPEGGTSVGGLRVPIGGTLNDIAQRHIASLNRLPGDEFTLVPPLNVFSVVKYRRAADPPSRPFAAFEIRTPDLARFQPFSPTRCTRDVAGMVRHAVSDLAQRMKPFGWTHDDIGEFVHGHRADGGDAGRRFSYLPLPSLEYRQGESGRHVSAIRRVLVVAPPGHRDAAVWVRVLSGHALAGLGIAGPAAVLRLIDLPESKLRTDTNLGPYVGEAAVWSTVTPVLLPGYDDPDHLRKRLKAHDVGSVPLDAETRKNLLRRLDDRIESLLRKAFRQAGVPPELVRNADIEFRKVGFRPGVELASRYEPPRKLKHWPRYHVRVRWMDANGRDVRVPGPFAVGAGRHRGLGVFAAESD